MLSTTSDKEPASRGFAAQLPRNLAANIAYFLVSIVIGVLLVPYFVSTLGVAAYGLIPLATSITGYVAIVVQSLNTAVTRFLTIDLQRGDYAAANRTFNTSLFGLTAVILLMIPVVLVVAYFVPSIFNVPAGQEAGAILLFLGVSASFLIRAWSGNFTVQLFAYNRLDLQNLVNFTNLIVQTGLIVLLFTLFGPDLALIGGAHLTGAVVASVVSSALARRICPHLRVSIRSFDCRRVKDLCGTGWWLVIDQMGFLFLFQIDIIVVNMLFGATSAGEYAIALQWRILLEAVAGTLVSVLIPTILTYYALKQTENLIVVSLSAVKFMGLAMALPVGLICGFAPQLLTIWIGNEYANLAPLMVLLTAHLAVNMSVKPLFPVNVAHNRVKVPGLMTVLFGTVNLVLAIVIPLVTGWGYYGVAVAGVIILTLRHTLFVPWYTARVLNIRMTAYLKSLVPGALATLFIAGAAAGITIMVPLPSLFILVFAGTVIALGYGVVVLALGFTPFEKQLFDSYLPQRWRRVYGTNKD
jgi:O-antigen/teichoic acid export membrane protein